MRKLGKTSKAKPGQKNMITSIFISFIFIVFGALAGRLYNIFLLRPERLREKLQAQGIGGPETDFLFGNLLDMKRIQKSAVQEVDKMDSVNLCDDFFQSMYPYIVQWKQKYGDIFIYSTGYRVHLCITRPSLMKEVSLQKYMDLGKPSYLTTKLGPIFGNGIFRSNGRCWYKQKKIIAPKFFMEQVKDMMGVMLESTVPLLNSLDVQIANQGGIADIKVDDDLKEFSANVISKACFGSSYGEGREIFLTLDALKYIITQKSIMFGMPSLRCLPTKENREIRRLEKKVESLILNVVKQRREKSRSSKDLLTVLLENTRSGESNPGAAEQFIIDNCKSIYFAGHDTTAAAAKWSLMLLASHPEWQTRAQAEVDEICGGNMPNADNLAKMKTITMLIQETLRLYPPSVFVARETMEDVNLGDLQIAKGVYIWIPIPVMHRDTSIWGEDANEFRPDRFKDGVSGACKQRSAYMPFGMGSRTCLGQNFVMVELKILLCVILSKFTFTLSPRYKHYPVNRMITEPRFGVDLLIKRRCLEL